MAPIESPGILLRLLDESNDKIGELGLEIARLRAENDELRAKVQRLSYSESFGCLTREAFIEMLRNFDTTGRCIIYFDVDGLKAANERWGKLGSSARIRAVLDLLRLDDLGQRWSGDEFVDLPPIEEALLAAQRIQSELRERELSATFVVMPIGNDLEASINEAEARVSALKAAGIRNAICNML